MQQSVFQITSSKPISPTPETFESNDSVFGDAVNKGNYTRKNLDLKLRHKEWCIGHFYVNESSIEVQWS